MTSRAIAPSDGCRGVHPSVRPSVRLRVCLLSLSRCHISGMSSPSPPPSFLPSSLLLHPCLHSCKNTACPWAHDDDSSDSCGCHGGPNCAGFLLELAVQTHTESPTALGPTTTSRRRYGDDFLVEETREDVVACVGRVQATAFLFWG